MTAAFALPSFAPLPPSPRDRQYRELFFEAVPLHPNPYPYGVIYRVSACLTRSNFKERRDEPVIIIFVQHFDLDGWPEANFEAAVASGKLRTRQPAHIPVGSTASLIRKAMARLQNRIRETYGIGLPDPPDHL